VGKGGAKEDVNPLTINMIIFYNLLDIGAEFAKQQLV
jgi:hypothetical protein